MIKHKVAKTSLCKNIIFFPSFKNSIIIRSCAKNNNNSKEYTTPDFKYFPVSLFFLGRHFLVALVLFMGCFGNKICWASNKSNKKHKIYYKVICEDPKDCHPSVVGILSDEEHVCTGILVKPNLIATNLHCLPANLRHAGAQCKNRIRFSFPATAEFAEEFADCNSIISISSALKDTPLTPDYAFLQLSHNSKRKPTKINTEGVADNELLTIYKVDPFDEIGLLRKITCGAAQGSMLNPLFKSAQSSVISLIPCNIVSGNSGSPLLSATNEVKGLVNSTGLPADLPSSLIRFQTAFASNFSCLNLPEIGILRKNMQCQNSLDRASIQNASGTLVREAVHPLMPNFAKNVGDQFKSIQLQTKDFVKWETHQQDIPYSGEEKSAIAKVGFKPKCIDTSRERLQEMDEFQSIKYSQWGIVLHLDSAGRPNPHLAAEEIEKTLSFSKQELDQSRKEKTVSIKINQDQFNVPFCSEMVTQH
jgi:hypothetical protein